MEFFTCLREGTNLFSSSVKVIEAFDNKRE